MVKNENVSTKDNSNEVVGKFFALTKSQNGFIQGWIALDKSLKQFIKNIKEEVEYESDVERIIIEHYLLLYIDTNNNKLIEIKDEKIFNSIRRKEKIFIVLIDKSIKINNIEDLPLLYNWYLKNLANYET
ncbi:MAG: hypothetical protein ACFFEY_20440 [Candidatus Thorarchaeota archaeon]